MLFFQLATGEIESAVYKKLIAPFKNDLPISHLGGFGRVCADHKYAYFGLNILNTKLSLSLPCQPVPLPETSYEFPWAFVISKNSSYKGLINLRWEKTKVNYIYDTQFTTFSSSQFAQHTRSCLSIVRHNCFNNRNVISSVIFLRIDISLWMSL